MIEPVAEPSELEKLKQRISEALWLSGKLQYEIEVKGEELAEVKIRLRNLNQEAKKFQKDAEKVIRKEALKVNLGGPNAGQMEN